MLEKLIARHGLLRTTLLVTGASVVASVLLASVVMIAVIGRPTRIGVALSVLVPAVCAPAFTWFQLRLIVELQDAKERLRRLAITDELSQAFNRRHFLELAEQELARAARHADDCSVVVLDLDDFKQLNDEYGHSAGDVVLHGVSECCRATIRAYDVFARLGGEEFAVLLPGTGELGALEITERLRQRIEGHIAQWEGHSLRVTASFGVAALCATMPRLDTLIRWADQAMYAAKRNGKNCTFVARETRGAPDGVELVGS